MLAVAPPVPDQPASPTEMTPPPASQQQQRRGWLGVRIQQVTDDIADSLNIRPARGALVAGVDDMGPSKQVRIELGDVIVKFDGKEIKEMRDLPRTVYDTPVGKDVDVVVVRKGKEENKRVRVGLLLPDSNSTERAQPTIEGSLIDKKTL
jgi:serine protease Do